MMHTEAGIIGHKGFNSAGIGVCVNVIRCEEDTFQPGLPAWIRIRAILNATSLPDCLKTMMTYEGPNSVNLLIAHREGEAIDLEMTPDDVFCIYPENGILTHTNHFQSLRLRMKDTGQALLPDTVIRNNRLLRLLKDRAGALGVDSINDLLQDHFGWPNSICRHSDERLGPHDQWETLTSFVIDLTAGTIHYTNGPPCSNSVETVALDEGSGS
jgi:isopenicillin-N N-acyltransferase-like protein